MHLRRSKIHDFSVKLTPTLQIMRNLNFQIPLLLHFGVFIIKQQKVLIYTRPIFNMQPYMIFSCNTFQSNHTNARYNIELKFNEIFIDTVYLVLIFTFYNLTNPSNFERKVPSSTNIKVNIKLQANMYAPLIYSIAFYII